MQGKICSGALIAKRGASQLRASSKRCSNLVYFVVKKKRVKKTGASSPSFAVLRTRSFSLPSAESKANGRPLVSKAPWRSFGAHMPTCLISAFREENVLPRRKISVSWRASVSVRGSAEQNRPKRPNFSRTEAVARHFCPKNHSRSSFRAKTARNFHSRGAFSSTEVVARHSNATLQCTEAFCQRNTIAP